MKKRSKRQGQQESKTTRYELKMLDTDYVRIHPWVRRDRREEALEAVKKFREKK